MEKMRTAAVLACGLAGTAAAQDFSSFWHDGKAEIDGYRLRVTRYARERPGQAVMIFVTEPFSESRRVKVDDPSRDPGDAFDCLKLNMVRDFQTGIYDYNTMTSVFSRSSSFEPVKVSFSGAEWCGHVYEELLVDADGVRERLFSYFENESGTRTLPGRAGGVLEDNLFIQLRGLRGEYLPPGGSRQVAFLPSAFQRRMRHRPLAWTTAEIERLAEPETVTVPAGEFETAVYVVRVEDGREGRFHVETDHPHRVVRWSWGTSLSTFAPPEAGETGELTGTVRVEYWRLNGEGDERYLDRIGLAPLASGQ